MTDAARLRYLSVCSGIEAATVAWHPLGWEPAAFSEVDKFPCAVLAHHYPDVPNWGDMTKFKEWPDADVDVLVGGTPCQSFSVAGLRKGMDDPRGNLALTYLAIAARYRPQWLVWENVPGVLSSNGGRDFGSILGGMVELGYGIAYRVLDAQYFRVPQRRRRVFVVGYLGDWRRAAAVLFERESLLGNPPPRREAGEGLASAIDDGPVGSLCADTHPEAYSGQDAYTGRLIPHAPPTYAFKSGQSEAAGGTFVTEGYAPTLQAANNGSTAVPAICFSVKDYGADAGPLSPTLRSGGHDKSHANGGVMPAVAYSIMPMNSGQDYKARETDVAQPLMAGGPVGGNQGGDVIAQPVAFVGVNHGKLGNGASESAANLPAGSMRVRKSKGRGASQERGLARSQAREPGAPVPQLPHEGTPENEGLLDLCGAAQRAGILRKALPEAEETRRPYEGHHAGEETVRGDGLRLDEPRPRPVQQARPAIETGQAGNAAENEAGVRFSPMAVRRLTPVECEALQGFPKNYTLIPWRGGKPAADGPRYKALGNSMAVPCMRWLGERIAMLEALT